MQIFFCEVGNKKIKILFTRTINALDARFECVPLNYSCGNSGRFGD